MKPIRGHYDGNVVVLDEPAPVKHKVPVVVQFPDDEPEANSVAPKRYHWDETRKIQDGYSGSVSDEVIRQRRMD
jgi:hypothetical protein